jgi:Tol biopolymer transport system component
MRTSILRSRGLCAAALLLVGMGCSGPDVTGPTIDRSSVHTGTAGSLSAAGKIAFASRRDGNTEIYTMSATGSGLQRLTNDAARDESPAWTRDHTRIAFASSRAGGTSSIMNIYVMNADGSGVIQRTAGAGVFDNHPTWSPDGTKIAFDRTVHRFINGRIVFFEDIYVITADGSSTKLTSTGTARSPAWSPDGAKIAFERGGDIYVMSANGSGVARLTSTLARDYDPAWSPDGTKLAFFSNPSDCCGNYDIYVMNANGSGATPLTRSAANDAVPTWSPDGGKIAFSSGQAGASAIYTMRSDGMNITRLTEGPADFSPAWGP